MKNNPKNKKKFVKSNFTKTVDAKPVASNAPKETAAAKEESNLVRNVLIGLVAALLLMVMSATFPKNKTSLATDGTPVVAKVGNEVITLGDLKAKKNSIPQLKDIEFNDVYDKLLESFIDRKVILDAAKKANIQNEADVKRVLKEAQDNILIQAYLTRKVEARRTNQALQALYQEALKDFKPQDEIRARHILVATEREAKDIIIKLKNGADFAKLADQYSLDKGPNGTNGGELGYFTKEMMIPDFGNAAFAVKVGDYTRKPVKTPFGWHVIKVEDKRKAAPPSFEASIDVLKVRFDERELPQVIRDERKNAKVQIIKNEKKK